MKTSIFRTCLKNWIESNAMTQKKASSILKVPERTLRDWLGGYHFPHKDRQHFIQQKIN